MALSGFRRLCHWGPIAVIGIIKLITWAMVHHLGMYWPPHASLGGAINSGVFLTLAAATLYYFLQSLLEGPGFVPADWKPESIEEIEYLQYCEVCKSYKAPRSHHCRKCGRCVLKMDHHCPWINCCVGHRNHAYFNMFLVAAVGGCAQASVILAVSLYQALNRSLTHRGLSPRIYLTLSTLLVTLLAVGMAVGVVLAVGTLCYLQIRGILRNRTTIEDWIMEKAISRRKEQGLPEFIYPYDLGWRRNLAFVLLGERCDGLRWPVKEGCGKYDLTVEQKAQKRDKRSRSRLYSCRASYSGRWVPLLSRPRAALAAPCSDDPRLPLAPGDRVRATRQRSHWLFGEKVVPASSGRGPRGWFPRDAVVPTDELDKQKPD